MLNNCDCPAQLVPKIANCEHHAILTIWHFRQLVYIIELFSPMLVVVAAFELPGSRDNNR